MSPVSITKEANEYLSNTIGEHKALGVQLSVEGGGCAGFNIDTSYCYYVCIGYNYRFY